MLYNWNRDYRPALGGYAQFDPTGLEGGINGYAYADGSPASLVDPSGLKPIPNIPGISSPVAPEPIPELPPVPSPAIPGAATAIGSCPWCVLIIGLITPSNAPQGPGCDDDPWGERNPACNPQASADRASKRASQQAANIIAGIQKRTSTKTCPDDGDDCEKQWQEEQSYCRSRASRYGASALSACLTRATDRLRLCQRGQSGPPP